MNHNQQSIPSPCIRNCCLDNNDICLGCFRSLSEITGWTQVNKETQQHYLNNAEYRRKAHLRKYHLPKAP